MQYVISLIILTSILSGQLSYGQAFNHQLKFDIDKDGEEETFLFFDDYKAEFEDTEFTRFCILDNNDSIWVNNENVWVVKPELYKSKADINLDDRIGLINFGGAYLIWLTGFEYGCCYNNTTMLKYRNSKVSELFNKDFEVNNIEIINGSKYLVGRYALMEQYGNMNNDYYYQSYFPKEYRKLDGNLQIDERLTQKRNIEEWTSQIIEPLDVYSARIIILSRTKEKVLVSEDLASQLEKRRYGITSLTKLNESYFENYSKESLRLIRNELFASRGYRFNSEDLQKYFNSQPWYEPSNKTAEQVYNELSEIEKHNLELIKRLEIGS